MAPFSIVWRPLLVAASLVSAALVPGATDVLPPLGLLRGPLGLVALLLGGAASSLRMAKPWVLRPSGLVLFTTAALLYSGVGLRYVRSVPASGDEVEYLMLAQSLWRDHDLNLEDNFARGDHLEFTPGLDRAPFGTWRKNGRPISTHSVGLPLLLAPVYAVGGRAACVVFLAMGGAALGLLVHRFALRLSDDPDAALLAWVSLIGPPALFYSFHIYTEIPSAVLLVLAFSALVAHASPGRALVAGAAVACLPWLHVKMIPAAALLGLMGCFRLERLERRAFLVILLAFATAYGLHHDRIFGDPTPFALYGSRVPQKIRTASPILGWLGLLFDGAFGLLPVAPVFVVGLAGLASLHRRLNEDRFWLALLLLALAGPLLFWRTWWAGGCPPARFLVPLCPFLAVALAVRVSEGAVGLARLAWPLATLGLALGLFMSLRADDHLLLNGRTEPARVFEALRGDRSLNDYLPRLTPGAETPTRAAIAAFAACAVLLLDARAARRRSHARDAR